MKYFNISISSRTCHHLVLDPFGFLITNVVLKMKKIMTIFLQQYDDLPMKEGMLQIMFLVSLESYRQGGVHGLGSMTFRLAVQKFLNIE